MSSKGIEGLMRVRRFVLNPLMAQDGTRGLLLEFQPKKALAPMLPVRIALTEEQARDLYEKLTHAISPLRLKPERPGQIN